MRRFATFALVVMLVSYQLPAWATCEGEHYEYDHGECIDGTEDTTSTLMHAYHAGDALQAGTLDRARSGRNSYGRRSEAPHLTPPDIRLSFVSQDGPNIAPSILARLANPHDPARQRKAERFNNQLLALYRRDMKKAGLPSNALGTARWYFIAAAYQAFDGERVSDALDARILLASLSFLLTRSPIMFVAQADKRFYAERYAILGEDFDLGHQLATKERNESSAKTLARLAHSFLKDDLLVDPASLPIGAIPCAILSFPGLTCAKDLEPLRKIFN